MDDLPSPQIVEFEMSVGGALVLIDRDRATWVVCLAFMFAASADAQPTSCIPVAGAESILAAGSIVLLGEIHGTEQAPEAVRRLACRALELGASVAVGLEVPQTEQARVEAYLDGADDAETRKELLAGSFWQRDYQDGRTSSAMLELLVALRRLREATQRLRVVAIDNPEARGGRDAFMARRLSEAIAAAPDDVFIVLTGNLHNRLTLGTPFNPELEPMGYLLRHQMTEAARLTSLRITHSGGTAWVCTGSATSDCGSRELNGQDGLTLGIELDTDAGEGPYSGRYHVGNITASSPAMGTTTN